MINLQVIERLKYAVFGFDTFYVTSVENYKADGVVFKGNVRGKDPQVSYQKLAARMKVGKRKYGVREAAAHAFIKAIQ